jgi:hypothetical protein
MSFSCEIAFYRQIVPAGLIQETSDTQTTNFVEMSKDLKLKNRLTTKLSWSNGNLTTTVRNSKPQQP